LNTRFGLKVIAEHFFVVIKINFLDNAEEFDIKGCVENIRLRGDGKHPSFLLVYGKNNKTARRIGEVGPI
jgi:hypothetical protein